VSIDPASPVGTPTADVGAPVVVSRGIGDDEPAATAALLSLLRPDHPIAWVRKGEGLVGWGEAARAEFFGPERFSRAHRWWTDWWERAQIHDDVALPGSGPVAFGSFAFDSSPGSSVVVVPRVIVGRSAGRTWVTTVAGGSAGGSAANSATTEEIGQLGALQPPEAPRGITWRDGRSARSDWAAAVGRAVERINAGELDKVVLARDLVGDVSGTLDPRYPLPQLALDYPECWTFSVAGMIGATPELLVRRAGRHVSSRVLAGTVRRRPGGVEAVEAAALLASGKDLAEHEYAVQSVADALAAHCTDLEVPTRPDVLQLANVQHLSTDLSGRLADETPALALAASLHPTAAVCGTPTERAWDVIHSEEDMDRGRYAGPVGWFDMHGDGEFGIALRCGEIFPDEGRVRLFAGCGIVAGSTPQAELAESAAKFAAMRSALQPPG